MSGALQLLHCVRHGESTFNRASKLQASFAEPFIFDAELTDLGRQQARDLRAVLSVNNWWARGSWQMQSDSVLKIRYQMSEPLSTPAVDLYPRNDRHHAFARHPTPL